MSQQDFVRLAKIIPIKNYEWHSCTASPLTLLHKFIHTHQHPPTHKFHAINFSAVEANVKN